MYSLEGLVDELAVLGDIAANLIAELDVVLDWSGQDILETGDAHASEDFDDRGR